jgi:hypothetical protein
MERFLLTLGDLQGVSRDVLGIILAYWGNRLTCIMCDPFELLREAVLNRMAPTCVLITRVRFEGILCENCGFPDLLQTASGNRLSRDVVNIVLQYCPRTTCIVCDHEEKGSKLLSKSRMIAGNLTCHDCDRCHICNLQVKCRAPRCPCLRYGCNCK